MNRRVNARQNQVLVEFTRQAYWHAFLIGIILDPGVGGVARVPKVVTRLVDKLTTARAINPWLLCSHQKLTRHIVSTMLPVNFWFGPCIHWFLTLS